jgi:uncharacterized BrkB/YihY/UPF0761 family membrane protein
VASVYAPPAFVVILLWIYYSAQIVFFGAEFTGLLTAVRGGGSRTDSGTADDRSAPRRHGSQQAMVRHKRGRRSC